MKKTDIIEIAKFVTKPVHACMYHAKPRFQAALHIREVAGEGG